MNSTANPPSALALRVLADGMWPAHTVSVGEALTAGWRLIAAHKFATLTAAAVWFLGAVLVTAANFAMPVAIQWACLFAGLLAYFLGTGILARYALLRAGNTQPAGVVAARIDQTAVRFTLATVLVAVLGLATICICIAPGNPAVMRLSAIPALIIAVAATFVPYNSALGDPLGSAVLRSMRATRRPRIIGIAVICLTMIGVSMAIPPLGLVLMPWQTASLAYLRFHDPDVRQATSLAVDP